jgi:hypothetical protein
LADGTRTMAALRLKKTSGLSKLIITIIVEVCT